MKSNSLQEHGRKGRGEQEFRGRSIEHSHPTRNTSNSLRESTGAAGVKGEQWGLSSNKKRNLKPLRQQEVIASRTLDIPRCTSPVPFKQATAQLNLPVPKPQTRDQRQRQNTTVIGSVRIMKRHTSPYPTPASSPNGEAPLDSPSPPKRAYTCPALDLTEKYMEKMEIFLKSDLISKVVGPVQITASENESMDREPGPESGTEANPVPDFFVNPTHVKSATAPRFASAWAPGISKAPNPEQDLMNTDFIATLGSVQDLDEDMRDYLPDIYSDYFPGPEVPIQEAMTPTVTLQNMDSGSLIGLMGIQKSEITVAPFTQGDFVIASGAQGNKFLHTPKGLAHLPNDSEARTPSSIICHFPNKVIGEATQKNSVKLGGDISSAASFEVTEPKRGNVRHERGQSFFAEELTPPNSAHLSPSPCSSPAIFLSGGLEAPLQRLAPESIATIETLIIDPIMKNPALAEYWKLCQYAKEEMAKGKIGSLKDLESMFLTTRGRAIASSSISYQQFANASLKGIEATVAHIAECDQQRPYDPVYNAGYFTDKIHEIRQVCIESKIGLAECSGNQFSEISATKQEGTHEGQDNRIRTPTQQGRATMVHLPGQKVLKRKFSCTADGLSPTTQRPIVTINSISQRQQLGVRTQPLSESNNYNPSQTHQQPQNFPIENSHFMFDQSTGKAITQVQSYDYQMYHDSCSEMLQSSANLPFSVPATVNDRQPIGLCLPPTPVSAASASSPGFIVPPTRINNPTRSISSSTATRSKGPIPVFTSSKKEEAVTFLCELCEKRFPRPCDLTKHKKTHERPFKCETESCKYHLEGFPTSKERERHQNDIHAPNSKEWKCEFSPCQYKSKRESNCKQHMEKAHDYVYKRMKRNPRRRDQGVQTAVAIPRRRRGAQSAQPSATPPSAFSATQPLNVVYPQISQQQLKISIRPQEQNLFAQPFDFTQHPHVSNVESVNLLEPNQMREISSGLFLEPMADHAMNMEQSYYKGSPAGAAEYEQSPIATAGNGFEGYSIAHRGHTDASPTLASEDYFSTQDTEQYIAHFLPDFTGEGNSFDSQQSYQPTGDNFHYPGPDFMEGLGCEREGHTPD